jgi:hypothetical protein
MNHIFIIYIFYKNTHRNVVQIQDSLSDFSVVDDFFNLDQHVFIDVFSVLNQVHQTNVGFVVSHFFGQLRELVYFIYNIKYIIIIIFIN